MPEPNPQAERPDEQARCACDLDGVITSGQGKGPQDFAPLRPGASDFLRELHERYESVYIHTARDVSAAKNFLRQHGLLKWVADVSNTKIPSKVYIDDRGVTFRGNFKETLEEIRKFRPWWRGKEKSAKDKESKEKPFPSMEETEPSKEKKPQWEWEQTYSGKQRGNKANHVDDSPEEKSA